jgi:hypothetical protein
MKSYILQRTIFITLLLGISFGLAKGESHSLDPFTIKLLQLNERSKTLLKKTSGLLELVPVVLPEGDNLHTHNDHFGWPVATMAGETLIVVFHRKPLHWGGDEPHDAFSSTAVMTRSTDGGDSWSSPVDLKSFIKKETVGCRLGFGNSIGTTKEGSVVVVTHYGVFRSEDEGKNWEHLPGAFGEEQLSGPQTNNGPRLLDHPTRGLIVAGHSNALAKNLNSDRTPYIPPEIWIRFSKDGGYTWKEKKQDFPDFATPIEPTLLLHDGALLVIARCHGYESFEPRSKTWRYLQLYGKKGWIPFKPMLSTMRATDVRDISKSRHHGAWTQDTVDLCYNPVSKRIECVATDRNGDAGKGPQNARNGQTLNLWSIDPDKLKNGSNEWRYDGTLLHRNGFMSRSEIDGMHPGAAIVDEKRGVQHIFVYMGSPLGPSGIFRVTRTLDTQRLSALLLKDPEIAMQ